VSSDKSSLAKRLGVIQDSLGIGTQKELADRFGISESYASDVLTGKKSVGEQLLTALAKNGVNLNWLFLGYGPGPFQSAVEERTAYIPHYSIALSAGAGAFPPAAQQIEDYSPYRAEELKRLASRLDTVVELEVAGDSMTPTLLPGERVLVDMNKALEVKDGVWAVRIDNALLVKRLQRRPGNVIRVLSDNAAYEPYEVQLGADERFAVIGRVLMVAKRL
jgi:SOS-response transcriptional repressor LexA